MLMMFCSTACIMTQWSVIHHGLVQNRCHGVSVRRGLRPGRVYEPKEFSFELDSEPKKD